MPERWQREVEKLAMLTAPPSTASRIGGGPHGDGMPPAPHRGQRIAAGVVAFAVFGAAAALVAGAFHSPRTAAVGPAPTNTVVVHLDSSDGPGAALEYEGRTAHPQVGSYCWIWEGVGRCVDTALSPFAVDSFVEVPSGALVEIDGDPSLTRAVTTIEPGSDPRDVIERIGPVRPIDAIDGPAGRYVLIVSAEWPQGSVRFFFPIEVMNSEPVPTPSAGLVATLASPTDGTAPSLVLSYGEHERSFFMQGGSWPGVDGFLTPIQAFDEPIAAGTVLGIEGDANRVMTEIQADGASNPSDLDLTGGSATLLDEPGSYQLTFKGVWDAGVAVFPIWIHVVDVSGTPSPAGEPAPTSTDANGATEASNQPSPSPPGPTTVTVPDVVGLAVNEALQVLHDAGLDSVSAWTAGNDTTGVGDNIVVSQDPPAGAEVDANTPVRLDGVAP
jgi:PASTA domain